MDFALFSISETLTILTATIALQSTIRPIPMVSPESEIMLRELPVIVRIAIEKTRHKGIVKVIVAARKIDLKKNNRKRKVTVIPNSPCKSSLLISNSMFSVVLATISKEYSPPFIF